MWVVKTMEDLEVRLELTEKLTPLLEGKSKIDVFKGKARGKGGEVKVVIMAPEGFFPKQLLSTVSLQWYYEKDL